MLNLDPAITLEATVRTRVNKRIADSERFEHDGVLLKFSASQQVSKSQMHMVVIL
jgi:hypothetical protein